MSQPDTNFERLTLSAQLDDTGMLAGAPATAVGECSFCGVHSGPWSFQEGPRVGQPLAAPSASIRACPLCHLAQHLERPQIDEEALLIWLPEFSQVALNTVLREMHVRLWACGESRLHDSVLRDPEPDRVSIYYTRRALAERSGEVVERLGTSAPSEFAAALHRLSAVARKHQNALLGGVRLLPLGRFFHDGADQYSSIVAAWARHPAAHQD